MSKPIIQVENLSKQYRIGAREEAYSTFRESLTGAIKAPFQRLRRNGSTPDDTVWALKDVSFEVQPGEVVGIIGRNGAGKSTLLKVLSRITEPTTGSIKLYGRVASLLEVGTGFHPELTGRENIYLNGAILGMARTDIARQFDAIVDFAEVEKFIDTPVKRYSSGMYLRLAFAVAAHLEPEILVVDEVLAVGDAVFQKKCLGKMGDVAKEGRTVLFVSHNMTAVQTLCSKAIQLKHGEVQHSGTTNQVINNYLTREVRNLHKKEWSKQDAPGNEAVRIKSIKLVPRYIENEDIIDVRTPMDVYFEFWNLKDGQNINLSFHLYNFKNECIFNVVTKSVYLNRGLAQGYLKIPGNLLNDDPYYLSTMIVKDRSVMLYNVDEALSFTVEDYREETAWHGRWNGAVRPTFIDFTLEQN